MRSLGSPRTPLFFTAVAALAYCYAQADSVTAMIVAAAVLVMDWSTVLAGYRSSQEWPSARY